MTEPDKKCAACGSKGQMALEGERNGKKIYACSEDCRKSFDKLDMQQV